MPSSGWAKKKRKKKTWSRICCQEFPPQVHRTPSEGLERLLRIRLITTEGPANILCAYAPTLYVTEDIKNKFFDDLDTALKQIP